jgi:hypothetical protein
VTVQQPDGTIQTVAPGETTTVQAPAPVSAESVTVPGEDPAQDMGPTVAANPTGYN